jgi:aminotransferase
VKKNKTVQGLNDIGMPCFEPEGAFYAFPSVERSGMTSAEFAWKLLEEEKVAVGPGPAFGHCGEGFVCRAYAASMEDIEEALERMGCFVGRHG